MPVNASRLSLCHAVRQVNIALLTRDDIVDFCKKLEQSAHKIRVLRLVCMPK